MHAGISSACWPLCCWARREGRRRDAIGMGLSDVLSPWIASAPSTVIMRFCMGLVTGAVPKLGGGTSKHSMKWVIIGAVSGMFTYYVLYLGYSFLKDLILGNAVATCLADVGVKAVTSGNHRYSLGHRRLPSLYSLPQGADGRRILPETGKTEYHMKESHSLVYPAGGLFADRLHPEAGRPEEGQRALEGEAAEGDEEGDEGACEDKKEPQAMIAPRPDPPGD